MRRVRPGAVAREQSTSGDEDTIAMIAKSGTEFLVNTQTLADQAEPSGDGARGRPFRRHLEGPDPSAFATERRQARAG